MTRRRYYMIQVTQELLERAAIERVNQSAAPSATRLSAPTDLIFPGIDPALAAVLKQEMYPDGKPLEKPHHYAIRFDGERMFEVTAGVTPCFDTYGGAEEAIDSLIASQHESIRNIELAEIVARSEDSRVIWAETVWQVHPA